MKLLLEHFFLLTSDMSMAHLVFSRNTIWTTFWETANFRKVTLLKREKQKWDR